MEGSVLLLNQSYLPLNIMNMNKAIKMFSKGKVEILEGNGKKFHWEGKQHPVPIVMKMNYYVSISKKKTVKEYSKLNVWKRDKGICQYCGKHVNIKDYTVDHIHPRKLGGGNNWNNVVTACFPCNNKKDCKTLDECGMKLLKKPTIPKVNETIEQTIIHKFKTISNIPYAEWKKYL